MHLAGAAGVDEQMCARDIGSDRQTPCGDLARPSAGGRLDRRPVQRCREDNGVTRLVRNSLQEIGCWGNVVSGRVTVVTGRKRLRRGQSSCSECKRLNEKTAICFEHNPPSGSTWELRTRQARMTLDAKGGARVPRPGDIGLKSCGEGDWKMQPRA